MRTVRDNSTQLSRFITDNTLLPSNLDTPVHPKMAALDIILNTAFGLKNKRKSSSRNENKKKRMTQALIYMYATQQS